MAEVKYSYEEILKKIEARKKDGFIKLESEHDISLEDGKRLMEEGIEVIAFPTTSTSWGLEIIWDRLARQKFYKESTHITYKEMERVLKSLRLFSPIVIDNILYNPQQ